MDDAERLAQASTGLGHAFTDTDLLAEALTHPSAENRRGGRVWNYQRLEFLGDRVLNLGVADMLLKAYPGDDEGDLARRHAALVRREALARVARTLDLGAFMAMSRGEIQSGGRDNPANLADACEAVIGAMFLDGGHAASDAFLKRHWAPLMAEDATPPRDAKTGLQEWAQGRGLPLPAYATVAESGPAHAPEFTISVHVEGCAATEGTAGSKRAAEQLAAAAMLAAIEEADNNDPG